MTRHQREQRQQDEMHAKLTLVHALNHLTGEDCRKCLTNHAYLSGAWPAEVYLLQDALDGINADQRRRATARARREILFDINGHHGRA